MLSFIIFTTLISLIVSSEEGRNVDKPYIQDISQRLLFQSSTNGVPTVWDRLPFDNPSSLSHLGKQNINCYSAISNGIVYASSLKNPKPTKNSLSNPYNKWFKLIDFGEDAKQMFVAPEGSKYDMYIFTSTNLIQVTIDKSVISNTDNDSINQCGKIINTEILLENPYEFGNILSATFSTTTSWIATENGLLSIDLINNNGNRVNKITEVSGDVKSVFWLSEWNKLYVGTSIALFTLKMSKDNHLQIISEEHEWIGGVLDKVPTSYSFDSKLGCLWLSEHDSTHKICEDGAWLRYGYHQGLPTNNITNVAAIGGLIWVGSAFGLSRVSSDADPTQLDGTSSFDTIHAIGDPWTFLYFGGNRYLPDDSVVSIVPDLSNNNNANDASVMILTTTGMAYMQSTEWTILEKANALESMQSPRHDRHGLTSEANLQVPGDLSTWVGAAGDNDGLWTSMHAVAECYRFVATGDIDAQQAAWNAFEGLENLHIASGGYPHYPARTYCNETERSMCGDPNVDTQYHNSTTIPGGIWKGDTSSDEIVGHMMAYALIHDTVAKTPQDKKRVLTLLDGLMRGIIENDLFLIDPSTNEPTLWGFWNPKVINYEKVHYSERGLNSLEILSWLTNAYSVTKDSLYKDTYTDLVKNHGYINNALNVKIDNPDDDNHSDNELIMDTFFALFYAWKRIPDEEKEFKAEIWSMCEPLVPALKRTWLLIKGERSPLWIAVYAGLAEQPVSEVEIEYAIWTLRQGPIDLIGWSIDNSNRWDLQVQPFFLRQSVNLPIMTVIRPQSERQMSHYNNDPFCLNTATGGGSEYEPAVWSIGYWMMAANGLIK
jgi:hypothetical protein